MPNITERQYSRLVTEARRAGFKHPEAAAEQAGISFRNLRYDMSRSDASSLIDDLSSGKLRPVEVAPAASDDAERLVQVAELLGNRVKITYTAPESEQKEKIGIADAIVRSDKGNLCIVVDGNKVRLSILDGIVRL